MDDQWAAAKKLEQQPRRWWSMFVPRSKTAPKIDYTKIINERCSVRHELEVDPSELVIKTGNVAVEEKNSEKSEESTKLEVLVGEQTDSSFSFIGESWGRVKSRKFFDCPSNDSINVRTVELLPERLKVEESDPELYYSIDNEAYEVRPVRITLVPKAHLHSIFRTSHTFVRDPVDHPNTALLVEPKNGNEQSIKQPKNNATDHVQNVVTVENEARNAQGYRPCKQWWPQHNHHRIEYDQKRRNEHTTGNMARRKAKFVRTEAKRIIVYSWPAATCCCLYDRHHHNIRQQSNEQVHLHLIPFRFIDHPAERQPSRQPSDTMARILQHLAVRSQ
uniref:Uncharacterized protein n=1 Tax=Anopheles maculatus TaxID=74869 RepID=A0A182S6B3_9DIPT